MFWKFWRKGKGQVIKEAIENNLEAKILPIGVFIFGIISIAFFYFAMIAPAVTAILITQIILFKYLFWRAKLNIECAKCNIEIFSNFQIEVELKLFEILDHMNVQAIHTMLSTNGLTTMSYFDWKGALSDEIKKEKSICNEKLCLKFNVRGGTLWKNDEISYQDIILHTFSVPHRQTLQNSEGSSPLASPYNLGIQIRLSILNGVLRIQVGDQLEDCMESLMNEKCFGRYTKDSTQEIDAAQRAGSDGFVSYDKFHIICEFPLVYLVWRHGLPSRYLNFGIVPCDLPWLAQKYEKLLLKRGIPPLPWHYPDIISRLVSKDEKEFEKSFSEYRKKEGLKNLMGQDPESGAILIFDADFANNYFRIICSDLNWKKMEIENFIAEKSYTAMRH